MNDRDLLDRYAQSRCEASFAELVRRHIDLVFSAALRQTGGDRHLAEDVAQTVFTDLARKAGSLNRDVVLPGWLYTSARYAAAKRVRTEQRRSRREQEAEAMNEAQDPHLTPDWERLQWVLDDALHDMPEPERNAVLMRFFERRSFREIGTALGVKEDAARMRLDRALDKLRALLAKRGVISSISALATALAQHGVTAAPSGLASAVSAAALAKAAVSGAGALPLLELLFMTKTKSAILVVAAFAAASVPLVLQHQSNQQLANTNRELLRRVAAYEEQIAPLRAENARLSADLPPFASPSNELLRLRDEVTRLREDARKRGNNSPLASSSDPLDQTLHSLGQRAARLREAVNRMPHLAIPELAYLKEKDWIDAVQYTEKLETDEEIRAAYNHLRSRAKVTVGIHLQSALKSYVEQNNQTLPNKLEDLVPFLSEPLPAEILARYQLTAPPGIAVTDLQDHNRFLIEEIAPPVDDEFDTHVKFSFHGVTTRSFNRADDLLKAAIEKFAAANNGLLPRDSGRLAGYLAEPVNAERIQKFLDKIPPHVTTFNQLKKD